MSVRRLDHRGLTLVELLLGIGLFAMVALAVYGVFSQGLRVEQRIKRSSGSHQEIFFTMQSMVRDLDRIAPYAMGQGKRPYFIGEHHKIVFLIRENDHLKEVRYQIQEQDHGSIHETRVQGQSLDYSSTLKVHEWTEKDPFFVLARTTQSFLRSGDQENSEVKVLSQKVLREGLKFFYFGFDDEGQGSWREQWDGEQWPVAVRMDVSLGGEDQDALRIIRDIFIGIGPSVRGDGYGQK